MSPCTRLDECKKFIPRATSTRPVSTVTMSRGAFWSISICIEPRVISSLTRRTSRVRGWTVAAISPRMLGWRIVAIVRSSLSTIFLDFFSDSVLPPKRRRSNAASPLPFEPESAGPVWLLAFSEGFVQIDFTATSDPLKRAFTTRPNPPSPRSSAFSMPSSSR